MHLMQAHNSVTMDTIMHTHRQTEDLLA